MADDVPGLLNRQMAAQRAPEFMQGAYDLLFEELKFGLRLLEATFPRVNDGQVAVTAIRLFRSYLEVLDGIDHLVRGMAIGAAHPLARTLLEIGLQLNYVLQRNEDRVAVAYEAHFLRQQRAAAIQLSDPRLRADLDREAAETKYVPADFLRTLPDFGGEAERIGELLGSPKYREADAELGSLPKKARWFRVFGGPANARELCRRVSRALLYAFSYVPLSGYVHGERAIETFLRVSGPLAAPWPLRSPKNDDWKRLVTSCHILNMDVLQTYASHFQVGGGLDFAAWYARTIRPMLKNSPWRDLAPPSNDPAFE